MIAVVQRVSEASVRVGDELVGSIGTGLLALVAICRDDVDADVKWTARKLVELRLFPNREKAFDVDLKSAGGSLLLVSNFTVAAGTRQGRRPSFDAAADAQKGEQLFSGLVEAVRSTGVSVQTGRFRADMKVHLINNGPVTVILDSRDGSASKC
jgi:D-tyrosyl-tRNA(Tyr) deacylase